MENKYNSPKSKRRYSPLSLVILVLLACVFCVSAFMIIKYFVTSASENITFEKLQKIVYEAKLSEPSGTNSEADAPDDRLGYLSALYEMNNDLTGWLEIENTKINYPVMFTPQEPEYYLHKDFYGQYSSSGVLFIGPGNTIQSDNIIVYGHNMKDGSMFADLIKYSDEAFFKTHDTLHFDTLTKSQAYEIIGVFQTEITWESFPYYNFTDFSDKEAFDGFMSEVNRLSLYDTGRTANYGDKLVTLSTCSYHTTDGRLVVVAREKPAQ